MTTTTSPPITSTNSSANNTNTYDAYDVARIVGPTKLYVGDAVTYTAINPNNSNAVYTTGSFTWNNSRQDLLSLGGSGNPVSGVAIKPGRFTLQLTYGERGAAYLDGEIKEKKKKKISLICLVLIKQKIRTLLKIQRKIVYLICQV